MQKCKGIKNLFKISLNGVLRHKKAHVARMTIRGRHHNERDCSRITLRFIRATWECRAVLHTTQQDREPALSLNRHNFFGLQTLAPLRDHKSHALPFKQRAMPFTQQRAVMHKNFRP